MKRGKAIGLIGIGFLCGIIYLVSFGGCSSTSAADTLTGAKLTYVVASGDAACPSGSYVIGGGCYGTGCTGGERLKLSVALNSTTWHCEMGCDSGSQVVHSQAVCVAASAGLTVEGDPTPSR